MNKFKFMYIFAFVLMFFFFCNDEKAKGMYDPIIIENPTASEITYGEPLFESILTGGKANVEGVFSWKNNKETFPAGEYRRTVIFSPFDNEYNDLEVKVLVKVNKKRVYLKFEEEFHKQYDGTGNLDLPNYEVKGIIDSGVYVKGDLSAKLDGILIGRNNVILSGIELAGDRTSNYYLDLEGVTCDVHPNYIEKFGDVKHRVDFSSDIYVPFDTLIYVNQADTNKIKIDGYSIKRAYDIYLESDNKRVAVHDPVIVKIKVDDSAFKFNRLSVYNVNNGAYELVDYEYEDGYILYKTSSLGLLVFAQKELDFTWLYIVTSLLLVITVFVVLFRYYKGKEKINKYKSLKRSKDYEDC